MVNTNHLEVSAEAWELFTKIKYRFQKKLTEGTVGKPSIYLSTVHYSQHLFAGILRTPEMKTLFVHLSAKMEMGLVTQL